MIVGYFNVSQYIENWESFSFNTPVKHITVVLAIRI